MVNMVCVRRSKQINKIHKWVHVLWKYLSSRGWEKIFTLARMHEAIVG